MSRSKKWRREWAFFLGENGRRQYNKICRGCVHPCKQSFRAVLVACPHYESIRSKKCKDILEEYARELEEAGLHTGCVSPMLLPDYAGKRHM